MTTQLTPESYDALLKACLDMKVRLSLNDTSARFVLPSGITVMLPMTDVLVMIQKAKRLSKTEYQYIAVDQFTLSGALVYYLRRHVVRTGGQKQSRRANTGKKKPNGFTDGYNTYDDSQGRGNRENWQESFRQRAESEGFHQKQKREEFNFTDEELNDFMNEMFGARSSGRSADNRSKYHIVLDVQYGCSKDDVKRAYRTKMKEWHPDTNQHRIKLATEMCQKLNEAYQILG